MEDDKKQQGFSSLGELFNQPKPNQPKPPAHEWQDFALRVIKELNIPNFKRGATFKVCKEKPRPVVEKCLEDTKELCKTGERWKYFFKLIGLK